MRRYVIHGLVVESTVPLDARSLDHADETDADVRVILRHGEITRGSGALVARTSGYDVRRDAVVWTIEFHGVATAEWAPLSADLVLTVSSGVPPGLLSVLVAGPVMAVVALSRSLHVLHSSAAWFDRGSSAGAFAVVGPSGSGKSTVGRLLADQLGGLLTDDALRTDLVDHTEGHVLVHSGTTGSRLRTTDALAPGRKTTTSADGRGVVVEHDPPPATATLEALLIPALLRDIDSPAIRPLGKMAAVMNIAAAWSVGEVHDRALLASRLAFAASLAERVPVAVLEVPWGRSESAATGRGTLGAVVSEWAGGERLATSRSTP